MRSTALPLLLGALALVALPRVGAADPRDEVEELYLQSLEDYDNLRLDEAKKSIRRALRVASKAGISDTLVAKLHVHMGLVSYVETKDGDLAEEEFVKALEIDPEVRLDPLSATPTLEKAFASAQRRAPSRPSGRPSRTHRGPDIEPLGGGGLEDPGAVRHEPVERAYAGVNIPIFVDHGEELNVYRATLYYRSGPGGPYSEIDLEPSGARGFSGYIPASAVVGDILEYYISLTSRRGAELASAGSALDPFPVALMFGEGGGGHPDTGAGYDEPYHRGPYDGGPGPDRRRVVHLLLGAGSGAGYILGGPLREFSETDVDPGIADTAFHAYAELGYYAADDLLLLLATRTQFLIGQDETRTIILPSARLRYFYIADVPIRQFVGFGGGWWGFADSENFGYVENRVKLQDQNYVDTAPKGPGHVGVEGGLTYGSGAVEFVLGTFVYANFPQTSFQLDLNLGLGFTF